MKLENLPPSLSIEMRFRLSNDINQLKTNLKQFCLGETLETGILCNFCKSMIDSYHEGRKISNLVRMMDKENYLLNKEESCVFLEDLMNYRIDYFSDSLDGINKKIKKMNSILVEMYFFEEKDSLNLEEFIFDIVKRRDTERAMEVNYIDRWIMYNKLFSKS
jgi:hypothetical protein